MQSITHTRTPSGFVGSEDGESLDFSVPLNYGDYLINMELRLFFLNAGLRAIDMWHKGGIGAWDK